MGVKWFVDAAWPWSGVIVAGVFVAVVVWTIRNSLRVRGPQKKLNLELQRIGVNGLVDVHVHGDDTISLFELQKPTEYEWSGGTADALRRLAGLPDQSGRDAFWNMFPDRRTSQEAGLDGGHTVQVDAN